MVVDKMVASLPVVGRAFKEGARDVLSSFLALAFNCITLRWLLPAFIPRQPMSARTHRRRRDRREDEVDASQGKLGPDFDEEVLQRDGGGALTISEVRLLLLRAIDTEKAEGLNRDPMQIPTFKKCLEYCEMFSKYKDEDVVRKVRDELQEYGNFDQVDDEGNLLPPDDEHMRLSRFEMAQLANLSIEGVEEAKVLIPTLAPKDDGQLTTLLNELSTKRKFQT